jgi:hypothetical protein
LLSRRPGPVAGGGGWARLAAACDRSRPAACSRLHQLRRSSTFPTHAGKPSARSSRPSSPANNFRTHTEQPSACSSKPSSPAEQPSVSADKPSALANKSSTHADNFSAHADNFSVHADEPSAPATHLRASTSPRDPNSLVLSVSSRNRHLSYTKRVAITPPRQLIALRDEDAALMPHRERPRPATRSLV